MLQTGAAKASCGRQKACIVQLLKVGVGLKSNCNQVRNRKTLFLSKSPTQVAKTRTLLRRAECLSVLKHGIDNLSSTETSCLD